MNTKLGGLCFSRPVTAPEAAEFHARRVALLHDLVVHRRLDRREVLQEDRPWWSLPKRGSLPISGSPIYQKLVGVRDNSAEAKSRVWRLCSAYPVYATLH